jgi:hypothetical protein
MGSVCGDDSASTLDEAPSGFGASGGAASSGGVREPRWASPTSLPRGPRKNPYFCSRRLGDFIASGVLLERRSGLFTVTAAATVVVVSAVAVVVYVVGIHAVILMCPVRTVIAVFFAVPSEEAYT